MRSCGYFFERQDEQTGEMAFSRPAGSASRSGYPRFHIYAKYDTVTQEIAINLHLDQKKPIFKGHVAHSGEYNGTIIETEAESIKSILGS